MRKEKEEKETDLNLGKITTLIFIKTDVNNLSNNIGLIKNQC